MLGLCSTYSDVNIVVVKDFITKPLFVPSLFLSCPEIYAWDLLLTFPVNRSMTDFKRNLTSGYCSL